MTPMNGTKPPVPLWAMPTTLMITEEAVEATEVVEAGVEKGEDETTMVGSEVLEDTTEMTMKMVVEVDEVDTIATMMVMEAAGGVVAAVVVTVEGEMMTARMEEDIVHIEKTMKVVVVLGMMEVTGENKPEPIETFEAAGLRQFVLDNVKKSGYLKPTPVQRYALPIVMAGRDLMACAQTGSGKTAAFLLPIVHVLLSDPHDMVIDSEGVEPHAIIISPTRELTIQIHEQARKFSHGSIVRAVVAYGGTAAFHQAKTLMAGCHILVATPGRLMDYVNRGRVRFSSLRFMVLDEADRMLDMGFMPEVERMMNHPTMVPTGQRQTLMFSATFPEDIQRLAAKFLENYLFLAVGIVGGACADVEQRFYQLTKFEKRPKLVELLQEEGINKTLVFVETKRTADFIASYLSENNFPTTSIHGDRLQREREEALSDFKSGRRGVLVATAVAARGLDIKNVAHVVNFDLPKSIDEYVHRIGRTGRVGNRGKATSFYNQEQDSPLARDLVKILKQAGQEIPDFLESDSSGGGGGQYTRGFGGRDVRRFDGTADEGSFGGGNSAGGAQEAEEEW
uniref:RNA helicase n=1 Tax=Timema poppense TaxID=170557 RepID=A0A7R9DEN0_TIMPO|nr:unnamed protein product [Timema poppensis]